MQDTYKELEWVKGFICGVFFFQLNPHNNPVRLVYWYFPHYLEGEGEARQVSHQLVGEDSPFEPELF